MDEYLIICDDCLLEIDLSSAHSQLARMLTKMRHYHVSMIISTQYLKSVHPIARSQITHFICFATSQSQEVEKIQQECSGSLPKK
jgi:predicted Zn-dependent protease